LVGHDGGLDRSHERVSDRSRVEGECGDGWSLALNSAPPVACGRDDDGEAERSGSALQLIDSIDEDGLDAELNGDNDFCLDPRGSRFSDAIRVRMTSAYQRGTDVSDARTSEVGA
jgi:hypothetical protein